MTEPLEDRLAAAVVGAPGRLSVAVRGDDGYAWGHAADRVTRSASTVKVAVLVAVLRLVERGRLSLADPVVLPAAGDRVGSAGALSMLPSVAGLPLAEALQLMVALSDNDATNAVIEHAGLLRSDVMGELLADVPTRRTALRRRLMDLHAAARGVDNETCAADLADLLAALRRGQLLDPDGTATALAMLRRQPDRDRLAGFLPDEVTVAAKSGDLDGLRADVALLERGSRWVAVAVVADELAHGVEALPALAAIGALCAERLA